MASIHFARPKRDLWCDNMVVSKFAVKMDE